MGERRSTHSTPSQYPLITHCPSPTTAVGFTNWFESSPFPPVAFVWYYRSSRVHRLTDNISLVSHVNAKDYPRKGFPRQCRHGFAYGHGGQDSDLAMSTALNTTTSFNPRRLRVYVLDLACVSSFKVRLDCKGRTVLYQYNKLYRS